MRNILILKGYHDGADNENVFIALHVMVHFHNQIANEISGSLSKQQIFKHHAEGKRKQSISIES